MARSYSPPSCRPVVVSAAVTTSSNSGNLKNTASAIPMSDAVTFILDVTAYTGTAGPNTLNVYIDSSPDGGTTWYPSFKFATVSASTDIQKLECRTIGIGPTESSNLYRMAAITTTSIASVNTVLSADHRVRWVFGDTVGATVSATFALWSICQDSGTYGA